MKFPQPYTLEQIATIINCPFVGDKAFPVLGMNEIHVVEQGDIVFVDHPKYYDKALQSKATIVLINKEVPCPEGKALLISDDPFRDFNKLTQFFKPFEKADTLVAPTAKIGQHTIIQPGAFVGNHVEIGDHCLIHDKLISGGRVVIEDHVDLGALCTIDRGVTGDTTIKRGTKIDNHVHIGHDTVVGQECLIASQVGIAGCVVIEDRVTLWGQVGITSGVTIGEKAVILAQSGVTKSLEGGQTYFGSPAEEARKKYKELASVRILAEKR